ncbi:MAG: fumarylacetoacetate hydrolase family protein [Vicinamibacterales bacterium]|nr:fumarylacetoacetate hydrolase family protein [Vicinamibacterales bacterium]
MDKIYRVEWLGAVRQAVERDGTLSLIEGDVFGDYRVGDAIASGSATAFTPAVRILAPVVPGKIVAIGLNYKDHAAEQGKPLPTVPMLFLKPTTAVIAPGETVRLPRDVGRIDHEAEMAIVMRRRATCVKAADADAYILGVTCANDVTARDLQNSGFQYSHVKGFDTFAPLGPCVAIGLDFGNLGVEGWVNGVRRQGSRTDQLVFSAAELVEYISHIMTLEPGDVISTGTPSGVGPLSDGDVVTVKIEGVGELTNPVGERTT